LRVFACLVLGAALPAAPALAAEPPVRPGAPISSHAMLHTCCTPPAMKERLFAESKAMGARFIRVDVELAGIFDAGDDPDWDRLDEVVELSRRHRLPVLGIVMRPPGGTSPEEFGRLAGEVASHARDTIVRWEILNEPDGAWAFDGTPEDYARMLRAAYDAIGARVPEATVAMGGVMTPRDPTWIERVFAAPGADAAHAFDVANLHLRGNLAWLPAELASWRDLLRRHGFHGPVWVTEHGYPADPAYQTDPGFLGGDPAQAAYLTESLLGLAEAGADEVFVTLRDNLDGRFASEGLVTLGDGPDYPARRKASFAAVRRLVDRWPELVALRAGQRRAEEAARRDGELAAAVDLDVKARRAVALRARVALASLRAAFGATRPGPDRIRLRRRLDRARLRLRRRRTEVEWSRALAGYYRLRAALHAQHGLELANRVAGR
jgi:hypothetical protein